MSADAVVRARVDRDLKTAASNVLAEMGLTVSDAIRMMLATIAAEKTFPADLKRPNAETIAAMEEIEAGGLRSFATVEELMADLNAPD